MKTLSIIIPVYNEESTVAEVLKRVDEVRLPNLKKEIVVVNDGSTDRTKGIVSRASLKSGKIIVHNSIINLGKGAAVRVGLALATGDYVIIQDADLELNPTDYHEILTPIINKKEKVVYGSRFLDSNNRIGMSTRLANKFLTILTNFLYNSNLTDMETAYKAFDRKTLNFLKISKLKALEFEFEPEITAKLLLQGIHVHEVPVRYNPRSKNEGKKMRFKDGFEAVYTLLRCRFI